MDIFRQNKQLLWVIVFLVVLNMTSIGFFFLKDYYNPPHREMQPPSVNQQAPPNDKKEVSEVLRMELGLSEDQSEKMKLMRNRFMESEKQLSRIIRSERDSMNTAMFSNDTDRKLVEAVAMRIAGNEYKMEMLRFRQAEEFKSICTPNQLEKFRGLVKEIRDYFRPDNRPGKK